MTKPARRYSLLLLGIAICVVAWMVAGRSGPAGKTTGPSLSGDSGAPTPATPGSRSNDTHKRQRPDPNDDGDSPANDEESAVVDQRLEAWQKMASQDRPGALSKILKLEDEDERRETLDMVLGPWMAEDRAGALKWLAANLSGMDDDRAKELLDVAIGGWAAEEPLAAMDWVKKNLTSETQETGLTGIAEVWAQADPQGMESWVQGQQPPPVFWAKQLIQGLIPNDPGHAMEWCDKLEDAGEAEAARQNVIQSWMLNDPDGAAAYLKQHPTLVPDARPEDPPPSE